jgi:hypothetical protein
MDPKKHFWPVWPVSHCYTLFYAQKSNPLTKIHLVVGSGGGGSFLSRGGSLRPLDGSLRPLDGGSLRPLDGSLRLRNVFSYFFFCEFEMAFDIIFFFLFNFLFLGDILIFFKQIKKKNKKLIH